MPGAPRSQHLYERSYRALEYPFRIETPYQDLADLLDGFLAPFRAESVNGAPVYAVTESDRLGRYSIALQGERIGEASTPGGVVHELLWQVHKQAVASVTSYLALHAGSVAFRGRGVVLPGTTGSGKTTLVTALVRAGFSYLSDEAALIDPDSRSLHPFPKSLTLRPESVELFPELPGKLAPELAWGTRLRYDLPVDAVRDDAVGGSCRVAHVISATYTPGAASRVVPASKAETLVEVATNAFNLDRFGAQGLEVLAGVVRAARCYRMDVGDLEGAVDLVTRIVSEDPP